MARHSARGRGSPAADFRFLVGEVKVEEHSRGAQTDPRAVALYGVFPPPN